MRKTATFVAALLFSLTSLGIAPAKAAPETIAVYQDWIVYKLDLGGDTVCYALTEATDKSPRSLTHGDVFFMVASWQSGVATNQPSFMTGYELRNKPEPVVRIGSDRWDMYISDNESFIDDESAEQRLINAMKRGSDMRLSATSRRGNSTNYSFSLLGITDALNRVERECR